MRDIAGELSRKPLLQRLPAGPDTILQQSNLTSNPAKTGVANIGDVFGQRLLHLHRPRTQTRGLPVEAHTQTSQTIFNLSQALIQPVALRWRSRRAGLPLYVFEPGEPLAGAPAEAYHVFLPSRQLFHEQRPAPLLDFRHARQ